MVYDQFSLIRACVPGLSDTRAVQPILDRGSKFAGLPHFIASRAGVEIQNTKRDFWLPLRVPDACINPDDSATATRTARMLPCAFGVLFPEAACCACVRAECTERRGNRRVPRSFRSCIREPDDTFCRCAQDSEPPYCCEVHCVNNIFMSVAAAA